jgi:hypothetical protein
VPCNRQHLLKMPIFVPRSPARLREEDLHPSYRPQATVHELSLNGRANKTLDALGIKTIGALLTTPVEHLLEQWGFGPTSLDVVHTELKRFLLPDEPPVKEVRVDYSSFEALVRSLIALTTDEPRDVDVLEKRLGLGEEGLWSLGKLGEKYGLTRERIRQVEATGLAAMSLRARREVFADFWRVVFGIVREAGRRCDLSYLAAELTRRLNWPKVPHRKVFFKIMALRPEFNVDKRAGTLTWW